MIDTCDVRENINQSCSLVILVSTNEDISEAGLADTSGAEDDNTGTRVPCVKTCYKLNIPPFVLYNVIYACPHGRMFYLYASNNSLFPVVD